MYNNYHETEVREQGGDKKEHLIIAAMISGNAGTSKP